MPVTVLYADDQGCRSDLPFGSPLSIRPCSVVNVRDFDRGAPVGGCAVVTRRQWLCIALGGIIAAFSSVSCDRGSSAAGYEKKGAELTAGAGRLVSHMRHP
jgi:hypothetical protein